MTQLHKFARRCQHAKLLGVVAEAPTYLVPNLTGLSLVYRLFMSRRISSPLTACTELRKCAETSPFKVHPLSGAQSVRPDGCRRPSHLGFGHVQPVSRALLDTMPTKSRLVDAQAAVYRT